MPSHIDVGDRSFYARRLVDTWAARVRCCAVAIAVVYCAVDNPKRKGSYARTSTTSADSATVAADSEGAARAHLPAGHRRGVGNLAPDGREVRNRGGVVCAHPLPSRFDRRSRRKGETPLEAANRSSARRRGATVHRPVTQKPGVHPMGKDTTRAGGRRVPDQENAGGTNWVRR